MQLPPDDRPVAASEVKKFVIPTQNLMQRFRSKMAQLDNCNYDDNELGSCVLAALQHPDQFHVEFPLCSEHFSRGYTDWEKILVEGAMAELLEGLRILFEIIPVREPNGTCSFMFTSWYDDDLVIERLPY